MFSIIWIKLAHSIKFITEITTPALEFGSVQFNLRLGEDLNRGKLF